MTVDEAICQIVLDRWTELGPGPDRPRKVVLIKVQGKFSANGSIVSIVFDADSRAPVAVIKIPRNPGCTDSIDREYSAMRQIADGIDDKGVKRHVVCNGFIADTPAGKALFQEAARGQSMVKALDNSETPVRALYGPVLSWAECFHLEASEEILLAGPELDRLVTEPISEFLSIYGQMEPTHIARIGAHLDALPDRIEGRRIRLCHQHGDLNAHNVLIDETRAEPSSFSVIDWEDYRQRELPIHDINHFFTSNSNMLLPASDSITSYRRLMLSDGWYRDLYFETLEKYESDGIIDRKTFLDLTPLYFVSMSLRVADRSRQQESTADRWLARAGDFIDHIGISGV